MKERSSARSDVEGVVLTAQMGHNWQRRGGRSRGRRSTMKRWCFRIQRRIDILEGERADRIAKGINGLWGTNVMDNSVGVNSMSTMRGAQRDQ